MNAAGERFWTFLFPRDSGRWVTILRIGLGIQLVCFTWSLRGDWRELFGTNQGTLVNRALAEAILSSESFFTPRLSWLVDVGRVLGLSEDAALSILWVCLLSVGVLLIVGRCRRLTAIVAWLLYLAVAKSGNLFSYGVDNFTVIGLFYLVIAPTSPSANAERLGFHRRILQLHLCIIYFFGGISKALGAEWWNGVSVWRALSRPPFDLMPPDFLIRLAPLFPAAGIGVFLLESGYALFIWPEKTRPFWFLAILFLHLFIGLTMGLYLFALIMIVLNVAAFGPGLFSSRSAVSVRPAAISPA